MYEMPGRMRNDARLPLRPIETETGLPRLPTLTPDRERPAQNPLPSERRLYTRNPIRADRTVRRSR
jgi:hypothetical protein